MVWRVAALREQNAHPNHSLDGYLTAGKEFAEFESHTVSQNRTGRFTNQSTIGLTAARTIALSVQKHGALQRSDAAAFAESVRLAVE
ncbi:MAG: hypothetical protein R3C10_22420 [Pirellulales bacterium]